MAINILWVNTDMAMTLVSIIAGVILLYFGAELLVRGSSSLALRFGISALTVGLTVVAFGTSAPELVVSISAGQNGQPDIAVGNIIGSNIFNIAIILGISAIVRPLSVSLQVLRIDTPIMIAVSVLFSLLLLDGNITRFDAFLLFSGIIAYTVFSLRSGKKNAGSATTEEKESSSARVKETVPFNIFLIVTGLSMLIAGSRFFVGGAVNLAKYFRVSEAVIGLTIVAAGTS
ncbi:MAG: calcium/sodium antiporter, partial [Chitinispirillaceae bacterium]|nr:calcium/sodium antiporter [Chitinispirillaceae bacterium]